MKLYGLIKIHNKDNPARPVVSIIETLEYKLAKVLNTIIKPYLPNKFLKNSTDDFLTHIKDFSFTSNQFLVSFDAKSLFTNVPLNYTIDIYHCRQSWAFKKHIIKRKRKFRNQNFYA